MPRSSTITVTLSDKLMDAMERRASGTGWGVGAEIRETVRDYLQKPKPDDVEDEMHRADLKRNNLATAARKAWRKGESENDDPPYPTSSIVVSFPKDIISALETKKYGRRGGTLAGEVRIALQASLGWKND